MNKPTQTLWMIKAVHTIIWAGLVTCIVAVPWTAARDEFRSAFILSAVVSGEVLVLAANHFVCPLTKLARRYTDDTRANFDIYLPRWLARYNKQVFGTIFFTGLLFTVARWLLQH